MTIYAAYRALSDGTETSFCITPMPSIPPDGELKPYNIIAREYICNKIPKDMPFVLEITDTEELFALIEGERIRLTTKYDH